MSGNETKRLRRWLDILQDDSLKALEECKTDFDSGARSENEKKHQMLAFTVEFTAKMEGSPIDLDRFCEHSFWSGSGYKLKRSNVPLIAVRFMLGAKKAAGALYQQSLAWSKVVDYCVEKGMSAEDVLGFLRQHTIYGAIDIADQANDSDTSPPEAGPIPKDSLIRSSVDDRDTSAKDEELAKPSVKEDDCDAANPADRKLQKASAAVKGSKRRLKTIDLDENLIIDPGDNWDLLLDMQKGERIDVQVRCIEDEGFKRFRAVHAEPVRREQREDD